MVSGMCTASESVPRICDIKDMMLKTLYARNMIKCLGTEVKLPNGEGFGVFGVKKLKLEK